MGQKGIISILITIGVLLIVAGAAFFYFQINTDPEKQLLNQSPVPKLPDTKSGEPDLIIEKVAFSNSAPEHDSFGMPAMGPGRGLDFTVTIKNIGTGDFKDSFYIANSRSEADFQNDFHSHAELLNQNGQVISPNNSIDFVVKDFVDADTKNVNFLINGSSKNDKQGTLSFIRDESNYENNSYDLSLE